MPDQNTIPENYSEYLQATKPVPVSGIPNEKAYAAPVIPWKEAEQYTLKATDNIGKGYTQETKVPAEQRVAGQAVDLNANAIIHMINMPDLVSEKLPELNVKVATSPIGMRTEAGELETIGKGIDVTIQPPKQLMEDIAAREKEDQASGIKKWSDIVGKTVMTGTLIQVDDAFKRDNLAYYNKLKKENPTWTGEQMVMDIGSKGQAMPMARNPSAWFKKNSVPDALPGVTVTTGSVKPKDEDMTKWIEKVTAVSDEDKALMSKFGTMPAGERMKAFLQPEMKFPSYKPLASFVYSHPEMMDALNKRLLDAPPEELAREGGRLNILQKAINDTYFSDQKDVPPAVYDALQSYNYYTAFKQKFENEQSDISAKMKLVGENAMGKDSPELNELMALSARKLSDPASITDNDKKRYGELLLNVTNNVMEKGKGTLPELWKAYLINQQGFIAASKKVTEDLQPLATDEGQKGLALYLKRKKGDELLGQSGGLFPLLKDAEKKQIERTKQGDPFSIPRSLLAGATEGIETAYLGASILATRSSAGRYKNAMLVTNGGHAEELGWTATPEMPYGAKRWYDEAANMIGNIAPGIALGQFGKAPELAYFMLGTYQNSYIEARDNGMNELQAQMIGGLKGGLMGLIMHYGVLPSELAKSGIEKLTTEELLKTGFAKQGMYDLVMNKVLKLIPGKEDLKNIVTFQLQNLLTEVSDYGINKGVNAATGKALPTNQFDNVGHEAIMNAVVGYALGATARMLPEARGARMEILKQFNDDPATMTANLEQSKRNALAAGDFKTLAALNKATDFLASSWAKESKLPTSLDKAQRTAALSVMDEIKELENKKSNTDPVFHDQYDTKINDLKKELGEIVGDKNKAVKIIEKETKPVQQALEEQVFKQPEAVPVEEAKPAEPDGQAKMPKEEFQAQALDLIEKAKDSDTDWRPTIDMSQKDREQAIADIKAGKKTKRAEKLQAAIDEMYDKGVVSVNRGRGAHAEAYDIPFKDWFSERTPEETQSDFSQLTPEQQKVAEQDYETEQQLTDEYWKQHKETNGFAEEKPGVKTEQDARAAEKDAKKQSIDEEMKAAPEEEKPYHEQRKELVDKYGMDSD